jgi:hypothetical protein
MSKNNKIIITTVTDFIKDYISKNSISKTTDLIAKMQSSDFMDKVAAAIPSNKKDPNRPKKPITLFFRFSAENRAKVSEALQKKGGDKPKNTDITKRLGELWKEFSEKAKNPKSNEGKQAAKWQKELDAAMVEYKSKMEDYVPAPGYKTIGKAKKVASRDPLAPKKPKTAYQLYCDEHRKPGVGMKELGEGWKTLQASESKADKKSIEALQKNAAELKAEYEEAMKTYEPADGYDDKGRRILSDEEKAVKKAARKNSKTESESGSDSESEKPVVKKSSNKKPAAKSKSGSDSDTKKSSAKKVAKKVVESDSESDSESDESD